MAEAKIVLNLSPTEFDLLREVLAERRKRCSELSQLSHPDRAGMTPEERRESNALGLKLDDILRRLK